MRVCRRCARWRPAVCGTVARRARSRACSCARRVCVRDAAHVRLGATMASELAEKRSAICVGWVDRRSGCEGTLPGPDRETSADFSCKRSAVSADFSETSKKGGLRERSQGRRRRRTQRGGAAVPPVVVGMVRGSAGAATVLDGPTISWTPFCTVLSFLPPPLPKTSAGSA